MSFAFRRIIVCFQDLYLVDVMTGVGHVSVDELCPNVSSIMSFDRLTRRIKFAFRRKAVCRRPDYFNLKTEPVIWRPLYILAQ
jgi:hypothetical protein